MTGKTGTDTPYDFLTRNAFAALWRKGPKLYHTERVQRYFRGVTEDFFL